MTSGKLNQRSGTCACCREIVEVDGDNAGVCRGRLLCRECTMQPVAFEAECLDCDWTYRYETRESEKGAGRTRVQQEGNSHETVESFDDEDHETVWREVEPDNDT